jgi:hypothetical protein
MAVGGDGDVRFITSSEKPVFSISSVEEASAGLNQTPQHSYTTRVVLFMVTQPSWLRAQAGGPCHQDLLSGIVPISCGSI